MLASISHGYPEAGMPAFEGTLDEAGMREITTWLLSQRGRGSILAVGSVSLVKPLGLPQGVVHTATASFQVETLAKLSRPYGMAFLPDGRLLLTEQTGALRVYAGGKLLADPILDTPRHKPASGVYARTMLDVAVHPNGWIYLTHGGLMEDGSRAIILSRGHIRQGHWVDHEEILRMPSPGEVTGGRLAIDGQGYVYTALNGPGMPDTSDPASEGPQKLETLAGKIVRIAADGSVPADNPFREVAGADPRIWTLGHRSIMGFAFDDKGRMLESEDGPRGGDEINLIVKGKNYGWPVVTWGHRYDDLMVSPRTERPDIEQPAVSWVPAPAVSSAMFYTGKAFPGWRNSLFVGSLKVRNLYRIVIDGDHALLQETILFNADRIRDLEQGPDGLIYIVTDSGDLVRLVPATGRAGAPPPDRVLTCRCRLREYEAVGFQRH